MSDFKPQPKHWVLVGAISIFIIGYSAIMSFGDFSLAQTIGLGIVLFFICSVIAAAIKIYTAMEKSNRKN